MCLKHLNYFEIFEYWHTPKDTSAHTAAPIVCICPLQVYSIVFSAARVCWRCYLRGPCVYTPIFLFMARSLISHDDVHELVYLLFCPRECVPPPLHVLWHAWMPATALQVVQNLPFVASGN